MQYLGVPYVWGGASPGGFDCSGFVMFVYAQMGVSLPHHAADQYNYGTPVSRDQLEPGDLVFFDGLGHVGIYIGGGQFVHAPHTGDVVKISSLDDSLVRGHVRRRPPALTLLLGVEPLDLGREVLLHDAPLELQRRRDLALLGREVARQDRRSA